MKFKNNHLKELSILKRLKGRDITLTIRKSSLFLSLQTRRTINSEIKTVRNKAGDGSTEASGAANKGCRPSSAGECLDAEP